MRERGLTGFQLKIIGLMLMVFDHIHEFFSFTGKIPIAFKWFGRLSAPIFILMTIEGYVHTKSKKKYIFRLYLGSILMNFGNWIIPKYFPRADDFVLRNNIFSTLLLIAIYLCIVDFNRKARLDNDIRKIGIGIVMFILPVALGMIIIENLNINGFKILQYIIPNPFMVEGGLVFIMLGVLMYLARENRRKLIEVYVIVSSALMIGTVLESNFNIKQIFFDNYQWMMIFAALLIYLYNGEKGRGMKYLFYIFYIAHIYLFYIISHYIMLT